jgi:hypothetical protein
MKGSWLQHLVDTAEASKGSSYIKFWRKATKRPWPDRCCLCAVNRPALGAHLISMYPGIGVVIVPACETCNNNMSKITKYAEIKIDAWAARVPLASLKDIERNQRLNARHIWNEAKQELARSLPKPGVPVPVAVRAVLPERDRGHQHDCARHYDEHCFCGRVVYPSRCVAATPPRKPVTSESETSPDQQRRTHTPRPPSPLSEPEIIDLREPSKRVVVPLAPVGSEVAQRPPNPAERVTLTDVLRGALAPRLSRASNITPRPQRRQSRVAAAQGAQLAAMQEVGRCKAIIESDEVENGEDGVTYFCNALTCTKLRTCGGKSRVYCCQHCNCGPCLDTSGAAAHTLATQK